MRDLRDWLAGLGLERYAEVFSANAIDSGILPALTERDLQKLSASPSGTARDFSRRLRRWRVPPRHR
jgi:hypothetical protein